MRIAVVGAGVIGLATVDALRRRGAEVVCLESDVPMAARSTGSSRIFRLAHADPTLPGPVLVDPAGGVIDVPVREVLVGVEDEIVEEVYCDFPPGLGDGIHVASAGPVTRSGATTCASTRRRYAPHRPPRSSTARCPDIPPS